MLLPESHFRSITETFGADRMNERRGILGLVKVVAWKMFKREHNDDDESTRMWQSGYGCGHLYTRDSRCLL